MKIYGLPKIIMLRRCWYCKLLTLQLLQWKNLKLKKSLYIANFKKGIKVRSNALVTYT